MKKIQKSLFTAIFPLIGLTVIAQNGPGFGL